MCVYVCALAGACVFVHPMLFYQLRIIRERLCLFKNKFLKWFQHDLSQQRGQEKSIHPSLFHSSSLPPTLLSSSFGSFTSVPQHTLPFLRFISLLCSPFLCAVPPLPQQVRYWSENKQTFAFILPPTAQHVCEWLWMRSTER